VEIKTGPGAAMLTTLPNSPPTTLAAPSTVEANPETSRFESAPGPLTCPHCGGSGILRMGDQQFRTCLDCLGQGQLATMVQQELRFPGGAFRPSVSHAR
jgi:hypothetical protein